LLGLNKQQVLILLTFGEHKAQGIKDGRREKMNTYIIRITRSTCDEEKEFKIESNSFEGANRAALEMAKNTEWPTYSSEYCFAAPTLQIIKVVSVMPEMVVLSNDDRLWDSNIRITTDGKLAWDGEVISEPAEVEGLNILEDEFVYSPDDPDNEIPICQTCHRYILKNVVVPDDADTGTLQETYECSNPYCESHNF